MSAETELAELRCRVEELEARLMRLAWPTQTFQSPMHMEICGCKVGTVCTNVACPHAMHVTCQSQDTPA